MFFLDYTEIRRFAANQKVGILLLFASVMVNSSQYEERMRLTEAEKYASLSCGHARHLDPLLVRRECSDACDVYNCHGNCEASGRCVCYENHNSNQKCRRDCSNKRRFGCQEYCECKNGYCNYGNGKCRCNYGWEGADCTKPCSTGYYGDRCMKICRCKNNASCNHRAGACICSPGYRGRYCEEKCVNGTHGDQCLYECKCQNGAICHHVDGTCECGPGWTGPVCADRCHDGQFGINCSEVCECSETSTCDFITGECICEEGFYGTNCDINCLSEEWGKNRSLKCNYENAECTSDDNICLPGFQGSYCTKLDCHYNKWGDNCTQDCNCKNGGFCHPVTGKCCCKASWAGEVCSVSSKEYFSEKASVGTSVIVAAICIPVILVLVILFAILFYKKRFLGKRKCKENSGSLTFSQMTNE